MIEAHPTGCVGFCGITPFEVPPTWHSTIGKGFIFRLPCVPVPGEKERMQAQTLGGREHYRALKFVNSPDFEMPTDANHDNIYDVIVDGDHSHGATCMRSNLRTKNHRGTTLVVVSTRV